MKSCPNLQFSNTPLLDRRRSITPSFGILSTYPPTPCGLATFSAALADGLSANGADVTVVRVSDGTPTRTGRVIGELVNGSPPSVTACSDLLNGSDIAVIQHEFGIYGGIDGDEVVDIVGGLQIPSIVVAHTVPRDPSRHQRCVLESVTTLADRVVVMSESARLRLITGFGVAPAKISIIPHGATLPAAAPATRGRRPTLLTWGLLGPGKGVERVIDAMSSLQSLNGSPQYLIAGRTHPKVLAADGETYRDARRQQAQRIGVAASVRFDAGYRDAVSLAAMVQAASVVVLPYDSTEQVTSGVLVDAIASGRPVVATAFPHAVELLSSGAGIVVDHDDPDAMTTALQAVLTQPRLAGAMAAEARRLAPAMAWPVVASSYQSVAQRILAKQKNWT